MVLTDSELRDWKCMEENVERGRTLLPLVGFFPVFSVTLTLTD